MKAQSCSSVVLFVICGLNVIACAKDIDEDEWIDPYDMLNYDPTTKRMRKTTESASYTNVPTKRREFSSDSCELPKGLDVSDCMNKLSILQKEVNEHNKKEAIAAFQPPTCLPVFRRFLSKLLKETTKLGLPDDANKIVHYDAEVKLSKQTVLEFQKLLKENDDWTTGAMDEALSQILVNFKYHDPEAWKWRFEDTFYVELDTVLKVFLCVLIITAVICTEIWSAVSWFIQFRRMFAICFFISLIWNWFHLYMVAFAEHQKNVVQVESVNAKCTGVKQIDWKDSFTEWYRHTWTLQDDPCKKYYEVLLVNPILLVPPTKAITVTITNFITDPLKHIGQGIGEFLRALLKDLPLTLQIPVLLTITGGIFVFMYGSAHAAIQHAIPWPRRGGRRDPPPPAVGQPQAPRLREHEYWAGGDAPQPIQDQPGGNRFNQGFGAGGANVPQPNQGEIRIAEPRDNQSSMGRLVQFKVETLRSTGNKTSVDNVDCQRRAQEQDPGIEGGGEPEAEDVRKEKEKDVSVKDKKEKDVSEKDKKKKDVSEKDKKKKDVSEKDKKEKDVPEKDKKEKDVSEKDKKEKDVSVKDKKEQKDAQDKSENEPKSNTPQIDVKTLGADPGSDGTSADATPVPSDEKDFRAPVQETGQ